MGSTAFFKNDSLLWR